MVAKAPSNYGERFAKQLELVGLLVVKKAWSMCPYKVHDSTLGVLVQLQVQVT